MNQNGQIKIALFGAGGKMGMRCIRNLLKKNEYQVFAVEPGEVGKKRLAEAGISVSSSNVASECDVAILAVPDKVLGSVSEEVVPLLPSGATVIILDPAAAFMKLIRLREDCTFVVVHPCHPPLFYEFKEGENGVDFFGGDGSEQDIVIALMQGSESAFERARTISIDMFAPVIECHRITVEQMAVLEPAAAEVVIATCACVMKEAIDEAIAHGVPEAAAKSFLLGHIQIPLAILFRQSNPFSDAAQIAIKYGLEKVFRADWKKVFEPDAIHEVLAKMLHV